VSVFVIWVADGTVGDSCGTDGDLPDGAVGGVALIVGVDEILRGPAPLGERGGEFGPVRSYVHLVKRQGVESGIVEGPLERSGRVIRGKTGRAEKRVEQRAVLGGLDVEDDILAAAHVDDFAIDDERMPCFVGAFVVALAVEFFNVQILRVAVERGKSPSHVLIVAGDDEREAGERDACGVEAGRVEVCHVPGVGLAEGEVHIVREERLSAGSVRAGDDPVVRS
jgi:hypothetical protein